MVAGRQRYVMAPFAGSSCRTYEVRLLAAEDCCRAHARASALQIRQLRCKLGILPAADGSALFEMGNTKVLAAVYGPREVQKRSQTLHDKCNITVEYSMVRPPLARRILRGGACPSCFGRRHPHFGAGSI